jgi:transposase
VRDALYMAAVAASRSRSRFADFYRNLRKAGKPPKLAFIALARKILTTLNAIMRDRVVFQP